MCTWPSVRCATERVATLWTVWLSSGECSATRDQTRICAGSSRPASPTGECPFDLRPFELDGVIAYIRAGFDPSGVAVKVGEAARGQVLFEGSGDCASCHRVHGRGPYTDRPPIVVPPTVLVQRPPEAWGEGR